MPQWQPPQPGGGLGTAALVLGIAGLVLLVACGLGVIAAIAGIVVGIMALVRGSNKNRAIIGLVLSGLTLVIAIAFTVWLVTLINGKDLGECFDTTLHPTQQSSQDCLERKLNNDEG
jgi:hypothetical protein